MSVASKGSMVRELDEPAEEPALPGWEPRADEVFTATSRYAGDGLRNHCMRLRELSGLLLARQGRAFSPGIGYAVALVHDLGILSPRASGAAYPQRSRALFDQEFARERFPRTEHEQRVIDECMLYNHRLWAVPGLTPEAEAFRAAVWIEHSLGLHRYGLDRAEVDAVFARHPRGNFNWVLLDFAWRVLSREPWTLVNGIFY